MFAIFTIIGLCYLILGLHHVREAETGMWPVRIGNLILGLTLGILGVCYFFYPLH
jgi:hypothetical protein